MNHEPHDPPPEAIAAMTAEIRKTWDKHRWAREAGQRNGWQPPAGKTRMATDNRSYLDTGATAYYYDDWGG